MISIETDDGEYFTITRGDAEIRCNRQELEAFLDEANILLLVTREREILELDDI